MIHKSKTRIVVGMSGGVDSSVTALLLKQAGYDVHGLYMKNWEQDDTELYCHSAEDAFDAERVAEAIGIPITGVNFAQTYWDNVFEHFLAEYAKGRTPNPDVLCNKEIKFKAFLEHAKALGADKIATGHYARVEEKDGIYHLLKACDGSKDQSYFLHGLNQYQLSHALFPLGELNKTQVRAIAKEHGLVTYDKKDSTGICFIGERKFKTFLQDYLPAKPGHIQTLEGDVIGHHDGLMYYTLGQRQGLGIGGLKNADETPWYVVGKDLGQNALLVAQGSQHPALFHSALTLDAIHWIAEKPSLPLRCTAKTRYRQIDEPCVITQVGDTTTVAFDRPQRAVTPGQYCVFYDGDTCLGGGVIESLVSTLNPEPQLTEQVPT